MSSQTEPNTTKSVELVLQIRDERGWRDLWADPPSRTLEDIQNHADGLRRHTRVPNPELRAIERTVTITEVVLPLAQCDAPEAPA